MKIPKTWSFRNLKEKNFLLHITKSVPGFDASHNLVCALAPFFLGNKSKHVDLGCSFGTLIFKIHATLNNEKCRSIGLDEQKSMILAANKNKKSQRLKKNFNFKITRIEDFKEFNVDLFTSLYTLQFINPKYRQQVVNKIYKSLNWGGGLILFEKIRGPDARFQDILTTLYNEYKRSQGISPNQILQKTSSLKGVLEPFSEAGNLGILKRAGFRDIMTISRNLCFHGWLCIK